MKINVKEIGEIKNEKRNKKKEEEYEKNDCKIEF